MQKEIDSIFQALIDYSDASEQKETEQQVKQLLQSGIDWKDLDEAWIFHTYNLSKHMKYLLKQVYPEVTTENLEKITFLYREYGFVECNLTKMADLGIGFSADVCQWLANCYLQLLITGKTPEIPTPDMDTHSYYHPEFGTWDDWYAFIESLSNLRYGRPEPYFKAYATLIQKKTARKEELITRQRRKQNENAEKAD